MQPKDELSTGMKVTLVGTEYSPLVDSFLFYVTKFPFAECE